MFNNYNWETLKQILQNISHDTEQNDKSIDWMHNIMDLYCNNAWWQKSRTIIKLCVWDRCKMKQFIPNVPAAEFHILPLEEEKRIQLKYQQISRFKIQVAFRLKYRENGPFIVLLEIISNNRSALWNHMTINSKAVELKPYPDQEYRRGLTQYYMTKRDADSIKYYSYIPNFRKLFLINGKYKKYISLEFFFRLTTLKKDGHVHP